MNRRQFLQQAGGAVILGSCGLAGAATPTIEKLRLSDREWRERLTPEQYEVLRFGKTEFAGSSPLDREYRTGTYACAGCGLHLFSSAWKYNSRTGWPSFWDAIPGHIITRRMNLAFRAPIEYHCARCEGHQGHVFEDGPPPTGLRYCNNGVALDFIPA